MTTITTQGGEPAPPFTWKCVNEEKDYKCVVSWSASVADPIDRDSDTDHAAKLRNALLKKQCVVSATPFQQRVCREVPMPLHEELLCCALWFIFFGIMLYIPIYLLVLVVIGSAMKALQLLFLLLLLSVSTRKVFRPSDCRSYMSGLMLKYFSHTSIWKENLPLDRPYIIVGPPHGVFPFGSLLACISLPRLSGLYIRGLAASALLMVPFVGARLAALGLVDASRENARKMLLADWSLGISSGGISEIFETHVPSGLDSSSEEAAGGCETIILKSRGGICKLALETGAYLVPSFIFGNTLCLRVWSDPCGFLRALSRRLRVSVCFFTGRFGLPIPMRVPILGVLGAAIVVPKVDNPSPEMVQSLLDKLCEEVQALFEEHKAAYGWDNVKLVIK